MAKQPPSLSLRRPSTELPPEADAFVRGQTEQEANTPQAPAPADVAPQSTSAADTQNGSPEDLTATLGETTPVEPAEPIKRLTIDIPESLHRAMKVATAQRGTKMVDEVRELLEQKYRGGAD